ILRTLRILKFYRLIEFIPNFKDTIRALNRALRASVFLISAFLLFNFVVSLFTYHIFKDIAPNNFGNGLVSFYSTMKTVAGEGFEVAEKVVGEEDARAMPSFISTVTRFYFLFIILTGGIIGLSLVNTVFINEVTKENNHELEEKLSSVQADMTILKTMLQQLMSEKSGLAIGRLNPDNPTNQPSDPRTRLPPNQE
ncbi:MAG: ion transporter, partial [Verrucomicrobia bacterium]|nr:ion transporter [Cytophagales bacterium]